MKKTSLISFVAICLAALPYSISPAIAENTYSVKAVAELPLANDHGASCAFIGAIDDRVILAGGSDFEALRPWEGGHKTWLSDIYEISEDRGSYKAIKKGVLNEGIGGGCTASNGHILYCIGGSTSSGYSNKIFTIKRSGETYIQEDLCKLPDDFKANAAEYLKGRVYIFGTIGERNVLLRFSPDGKSFKELAAFPGEYLSEGSLLVHQHNGREDALYLIGGRGSINGKINIASNIWAYLPNHDRWERKAAYSDDSCALNLMYSSAVKYGSAHILVFGGDDGEEFLKREALSAQLSADSQNDSLRNTLTSLFVNHKGFNNSIYAYHTITDTWIKLDNVPNGLPAATSAATLGDDIIIPSGEIHPGVRTNEVLEAKVNSKPSFGTLNYIIIVLYLMAMMLLGYYFSRRNNSSEMFFKGGGKIPWWAAGISIFATALSAITFLSIPAKAYAADWQMFMFNMTIIMIVPFVIRFFLPFFRKLNVASVYQYLEDRFDGRLRMLASAFFCLFMFARVAIVLFLPSLALNAVTGINIYVCILLMGIVTIIYSTLGGIEAVVWGDVIQGILLVGGALLSLGWIIGNINGGFPELMRVAVADNKFNILDFRFDLTQPVFWVALIGGFSNQLLTYTSDQSVVQKYMTVKDDAGTKRGLWLNGLLSIPIAIIFFGIGTALYVFFKQQPQLLDISMSNTDSIFPHFIMCKLPVGVSGLLIAAVFAAAMSTLSSNINSSTTVMTEDFYVRFKKNVTDRGKVRFARISGVITGGLGVIMALVLATFDIASLWDQFNFFLGLLTSGLGGLFIMGIFAKRIGPVSAMTGFAGSVITLLLINSFTNASSILYGFLGIASCFIIGYLTSLIIGRGK